MVNPKTGVKEHTLALGGRAFCCIFTLKHLIVSMEDGLMNWHKLDVPTFLANEKDDGTKRLTVLDEIGQEWNLGFTIGETGEHEVISHMHYSRSFKELVMGTTTGLFGRLEVEAEQLDEGEDEEGEGKKEEEKKILESQFIELGRYHTQPLCGIKELGDTTQLMTISTDHYMTLWEATT